MVLVDKKILAGGISMVSVGLVLLFYLNSTSPIGQADMTQTQIDDLLTKQEENKNYSNLVGMISGVGFLLVLISFGARKRKGTQKQ
ncbi:MAG: hypothetical protein HW420_806 [Candidatus Nitrosotenuis sp.]|jgi:hypothetical protein|nr:hypothetical protein [Candidatus Nitrosotenuis sp.]